MQHRHWNHKQINGNFDTCRLLVIVGCSYRCCCGCRCSRMFHIVDPFIILSQNHNCFKIKGEKFIEKMESISLNPFSKVVHYKVTFYLKIQSYRIRYSFIPWRRIYVIKATDIHIAIVTVCTNEDNKNISYLWESTYLSNAISLVWLH